MLIVAGSEKYRAITTGHYRFALGAVLVFDLLSRESFTNCRYWVDSIRAYADENVVIALVANKADVVTLVPAKRHVTTEEARAFARDNGLVWVGESSA
jgi:GTPase SAR1 family protein